jgi:hypothetical protein
MWRHQLHGKENILSALERCSIQYGCRALFVQACDMAKGDKRPNTFPSIAPYRDCLCRTPAMFVIAVPYPARRASASAVKLTTRFS